MLPLVNEENHGTYSRYLRIRTLDEETVLEAARIFSKFRDRGVIKGSTFRDDVWRLTDEVKNYGLFFRCDGRVFRGGAGQWCGVGCRTFEKCMKAYAVYSLGQISIEGIRVLVNEMKDLAGMGMDQAMRLAPGARIVEFISSLPGPGEARDRVVEAMEENRLSRIWKKKDSRKLSEFRDYLRFDKELDGFWLAADAGQKVHYFPVYFWWKLTAVLPLRPTEFLLTPEDCLRQDGNGWVLSVRRTRNKKAQGKRSYRVEDDYEICEYSIPVDLAQEIRGYQAAVRPYRKPENSALLLPGNLSTSWHLTYQQLHARLDRLIEKELGDSSLEVNPGDTRHLAMINLILSGGSPTVCKELAGHEDIDISSHYYANISSVIEASVYEFCHSGAQGSVLDGRMYFPAVLPSARVRVEDGWCTSEAAAEGLVTDCLKNYRGVGRLGECRDCPFFYPDRRGIRLKVLDERKKSVDLAADFLMQMIESVRRGNGSEESILAAMARIQKAGNDYAGVLYREHMEAE